MLKNIQPTHIFCEQEGDKVPSASGFYSSLNAALSIEMTDIFSYGPSYWTVKFPQSPKPSLESQAYKIMEQLLAWQAFNEPH